MQLRIIQATLVLLTVFCSCASKEAEEKSALDLGGKKEQFFVVPGEDELLDSSLIKKGEVLVAYSDCYQCHREESKAKGPSFQDIARRYPMQQAYIDLLARKVIQGGSGTWGYPVMSSHPKLKLEDAQAMVAFVLSMEKK
jgi:cytochrome c